MNSGFYSYRRQPLRMKGIFAKKQAGMPANQASWVMSMEITKRSFSSSPFSPFPPHSAQQHTKAAGTADWRHETGCGGMTGAGITVGKENHGEGTRLTCTVQPDAVRRDNDANCEPHWYLSAVMSELCHSHMPTDVACGDSRSRCWHSFHCGRMTSSRQKHK